MTEDIFDMSNVRNFKEIEKKNMGGVSTLLCLWSAELSIAFGLRNPFYSKISVVMLIGYRIAENSSQNEKYALHPNAAYFKNIYDTCLVQNSKTMVEFSCP